MARFSYAIRVRRMRDAGYGGSAARQWYYTPFGSFSSYGAILLPSKSKYADFVETYPELITALEKGIQKKIPKIDLWKQAMAAGYTDDEFSHHYFLTTNGNKIQRNKKNVAGFVIFILLAVPLIFKFASSVKYFDFLHSDELNIYQEKQDTVSIGTYELQSDDSVVVTRHENFFGITIPIVVRGQVLSDDTSWIVMDGNRKFFMRKISGFQSVLKSAPLKERDVMCESLVLASRLDSVCSTNYDFLRAALQVRSEDTLWYSSQNQKNAFMTLMEYKMSLGDSIKTFSTDTIKGVVTKKDGDITSAIVYSTKDQGYEFQFKGLEKGEIDYVLAHIRY